MPYAHFTGQRYREVAVRYQTLAILAFSTLLPVASDGQFTAFTPPRQRVDTTTRPAPTPAQRQQATADSIARVTITNMKAWVDSAAGDVVVNRVDSTGRPVAATGPVTAGATTDRSAAPAESTMTFRDGARAPDTATYLPLLLLIGTGAIGVGVLLLRWRPGA
jgi:hypothetical protein